jgi:hypothetical protein
MDDGLFLLNTGDRIYNGLLASFLAWPIATYPRILSEIELFSVEPLTNKAHARPMNKARNYRFFFGFLIGGAIMGLLLRPITSCMMEAIRMFASAGRFFAGFVMSPIYHANRGGGKSFFKVAHYRGLT